MQKRWLTLTLGAALLAGCREEPAPQTPAGAEVAAPAPRETSGLRADMFVETVPERAQLVFVGQDASIRPADHANAVFVPMSTFSVERDGIPNEFPPADSMARLLQSAGVRNDRIVIVGEPIPAGRAFAAFDYLGLGDRAALLDGGIAALEGGATGADTAAARSEASRGDTGAGATADTSRAGSASGSGTGRLVTNVREDMIVDAAWVQARLDDPNVAVLDARPPAEYSGETPGEGITRPGHIAGARNVFWQTLVESADMPRLKDEQELRRIFREAGVDDGDTVVAYCRTGGQASFLYTVARYLGYDVRLYDGSYIDWSRTDYPIETGADTGAAADTATGDTAASRT